jgi:hypothetical protein
MATDRWVYRARVWRVVMVVDVLVVLGLVLALVGCGGGSRPATTDLQGRVLTTMPVNCAANPGACV